MQTDLPQDNQQYGYTSQILYQPQLISQAQGPVLLPAISRSSVPAQAQQQQLQQQHMFTAPQGMIGAQGMPRGIFQHAQGAPYTVPNTTFMARARWHQSKQVQPEIYQSTQQHYAFPAYVQNAMGNGSQNYVIVDQAAQSYGPQHFLYYHQPQYVPQQSQSLPEPVIQQALPQSLTSYPNLPPQPPAPPTQPAQRKRVPLKIVDPSSGKDVLAEVTANKMKEVPQATSDHVAPVATSVPASVQAETAKRLVAAQFAAQVAAAASSGTHSSIVASSDGVATNVPVTCIASSQLDLCVLTVGQHVLGASNVAEEKQPTNDDCVSSAVSNKNNTVEVGIPLKAGSSMNDSDEGEIPESCDMLPVPRSLHLEAAVKSDVADAVSLRAEEPGLCAERKVDESIECLGEAEAQFEDNAGPEIKTTVDASTADLGLSLSGNEDSCLLEPMVHGHDEGASKTTGSGASLQGSAFSQVPKKTKKKQRMKDIKERNTMDTDLMSAFVEKPATDHAVVLEPEIDQAPRRVPDDVTWEDKEKSIDAEVIKNDDVEEREPLLAKTMQAKVINAESDRSEDEKLQYDRDFLLKFQFAPICTAKPDGLPDIEIVLDKAHGGTKALDQRALSDFAPGYMRSQSGGRQSGGRAKDRRGGSAPVQPPKKVIQVPQLFEKVELKKSENAWVRPAELAKAMTDDDRAMDELKRNVLSILNKLTPQKFQTLVKQIGELVVDTQEKLVATIDLIFEKAISEPGFSVAYANMCCVLTESFKVPSQSQGKDRPGSTVPFRKILLNKCQKEFEKEKSDEKLIEADKEIHFESEEKEKAWKEEIAQREWKTRQRTLGNIRFIGELFKLRMISENIMHECIMKLLRSDSKDSQEDSLECLCQLLTTIGKDLDHPKAEVRMNQYFNQMDKIVATKKISSRIKFAMLDVIDMRKDGWKPRRDEGNPKTIDQIHMEEALKEREMHARLQAEKLRGPATPATRPGPGGRGQGRDSSAPRGVGPASADPSAWQSVPQKGGRSIQPPIDTTKFQQISRKTDSENISLGPGGLRPGAWSQGASGGSSRPGSGGNTTTVEVDRNPNRYSALTDTNVSSAPDSRRGGRGSQGASNRRGGGSAPVTSRHNSSEERSSAVRAVKHIVRHGGGRSESPVRAADGRDQSPMTVESAPTSLSSSDPPSGASTPAVGMALSHAADVTQALVEKRTKATVEEFLHARDCKEAALCVKDLQAPGLHHVFVLETINLVMEKRDDARSLAGHLIHFLVREGYMTVQEVFKGLSAFMSVVTDVAVDIPHIYKYLGEFLAPIIFDGSLPLAGLKEALVPLVAVNKAGLVMAEALSEAVKIAQQGEESVASLWLASNLTWQSLLPAGADVPQFVDAHRMGFTLLRPKTSPQAISSLLPPPSHASQVQLELRRLLSDARVDNSQVIGFIESKIPKSQQSSDEFVRDLTHALCRSAVSEGCSSCDAEMLKHRGEILLKIISQNRSLELQALYALQQLAIELNHPLGLLESLCLALYKQKVLSEHAFLEWESSRDFPEGKGVALSSLRSFLSWLKDAEEGSNDEDINTRPGHSS